MADWERFDLAKLRRQFAEQIAESRADAHRQLDVFFDQQVAQQELQFEMMKRDAEGAPAH